ncbi:MAG TPA: hypothetical protein VN026_09885 [Bacteroidia bacterium]|jgi:hypothetical protein|nr:hypothetical protein [Bacteroidia bacterium]
MKKIFFISLVLLAINGFSQASFDINFDRSVTASLLNAENDSLFSDQAQIRIFETGSASSVELKYYNYADSTFSEVYNSTITVSSVTGTPCTSDYCAYKLNPSVLIINLGSHSATGYKHKVYIKINGAAGIENLIKEVEL